MKKLVDKIYITNLYKFIFSWVKVKADNTGFLPRLNQPWCILSFYAIYLLFLKSSHVIVEVRKTVVALLGQIPKPHCLQKAGEEI